MVRTRHVFVDHALRPKRRLVDLYPDQASLFSEPTSTPTKHGYDRDDVIWLIDAWLAQLNPLPRHRRCHRARRPFRSAKR